MIEFYRPVDLRSRAAMTEYLTQHFRYHTMNSWNHSTSYACNLKVHRLNLEHSVVMRLLDMVNLPEFYEPINGLCNDFAEEHNYRWQAGFNGRSGGYLVLYQGTLEPSGYKSHCTACGQRNCKSVAESGNVCGHCRQPKRVDYQRTHMKVVTYSGRAVDQYEDFEDWTMRQLRERVKLVQAFDRLCDAIVQEAIYIAENYEIEDEEYTVVKTRQVLVPVC